MAQHRSAETALDYVRGLAPEVKANCWSLAEATGHRSPYRMQACSAATGGTGRTCGRTCLPSPGPGCPATRVT
jgi:hypothetical protein